MSRSTLLIAPALAAGLLLSAGTAAQAPGPAWSEAFDLPGLVGRVFAVGSHEGQPVVGGYQNLIGDGQVFQHVARFDGTRWQPLGNGVSGAVRAVEQFGGDLVIGGEFDYGNGLYGVAGTWDAMPGVARWNGSEWEAFGDGLDLSWGSPTIWCLAEYQGQLYAGGEFDNTGGQGLSGIARWNGSAWEAVGGPVGGPYYPAVFDMVVTSDDRLVVVGRFDSVGGVAADNIAAWDGQQWSALGDGLDGNLSIVFGVEEYAGKIYACGNFPLAGGQPVDKIAAWDGSAWEPVGQGIPDWSISITNYDLEVFGGKLYVGGNFTAVDGTAEWNALPASRLARWDGSQWEAFGGVSGSEMTTTLFGLHALGDTLYVGGEFSRAGNPVTSGPDAVVTQSIAAFDGATFRQLNPGLGFDREVNTAVAWNGGVFAAGRFVEAGGVQASRVAFFDGTTWHNVGWTDGNVRGSLVYEGDVVITGEFSTVDGVATGAVARWDGTSWSALGSGAGGECLEVYQGQLYAGGLGGIRRWNGSAWETFGNVQLFGYINTMEVYDDVLYFGGSFGDFGGIGPNLAAWDGTQFSVPGGVGPDDIVEALTVHDGKLLVGGRFFAVGGMPARILATWDGRSWDTFGGDTLTGFAVMDFAQLEGDLYVGGDLHYGFAGAVDYLARWDGGAFQPLGAGLDGMPYTLVADATHRCLYAGGWFYEAGGMPSWCFARWDLAPGAGLDPWTDLGLALPGPAGTPRLTGVGSLEPDSAVTLSLADAPKSAATVLAVGLSRLDLPFLGGTLVPSPDVPLFGLVTDGAGGLVLAGTWPTGVPTGLELFLQAWIDEPGNTWGMAATNGLRGVAP